MAASWLSLWIPFFLSSPAVWACPIHCCIINRSNKYLKFSFISKMENDMTKKTYRDINNVDVSWDFSFAGGGDMATAVGVAIKFK